MTSKTAAIFQQYAKAFSASSDEERLEILRSTVDTEIVYRTPEVDGRGYQTILDDIQGFQAKLPGAQFSLSSISEHHDVALIEWQLILAGEMPGVRGHDVVRLTPEGKFAQITTFVPSTSE